MQKEADEMMHFVTRAAFHSFRAPHHHFGVTLSSPTLRRYIRCTLLSRPRWARFFSPLFSHCFRLQRQRYDAFRSSFAAHAALAALPRAMSVSRHRHDAKHYSSPQSNAFVVNAMRRTLMARHDDVSTQKPFFAMPRLPLVYYFQVYLIGAGGVYSHWLALISSLRIF